MHENSVIKQARLSTALQSQRDTWSRQVQNIRQAREASAFRHHRVKAVSSRESTLIDLQAKYSPRHDMSVFSSIRTGMDEGAYADMKNTQPKRLEAITRKERHTINIREIERDYKNELRNSQVRYDSTHSSVKQQLWVTRPRTKGFAASKRHAEDDTSRLHFVSVDSACL